MVGRSCWPATRFGKPATAPPAKIVARSCTYAFMVSYSAAQLAAPTLPTGSVFGSAAAWAIFGLSALHTSHRTLSRMSLSVAWASWRTLMVCEFESYWALTAPGVAICASGWMDRLGGLPGHTLASRWVRSWFTVCVPWYWASTAAWVMVAPQRVEVTGERRKRAAQGPVRIAV